MSDHDGEELRPATREELMEGLSFALRYQGRRRANDAHTDGFMAKIAAERLTDYLYQSGFVILKKPPAGSASVVLSPRLPLKD